MNLIEQLDERLKLKYPHAKTEVYTPVKDEGFWDLDIEYGRKAVCVQWSPVEGLFRLSDISEGTESSFGEGPDKTVNSLEEVELFIAPILGSEQ
jgi:hypothetical protein